MHRLLLVAVLALTAICLGACAAEGSGGSSPEADSESTSEDTLSYANGPCETGFDCVPGMTCDEGTCRRMDDE